MDIDGFRKYFVKSFIIVVLRSTLALLLVLSVNPEAVNPEGFQQNVTTIADFMKTHTDNKVQNNGSATLKTFIENGSLNTFFLYMNSSFNDYETDGKEAFSVRVRVTERCDLFVRIFGLDQISNVISFYDPFSTQWKRVEKNSSTQYRQESWFALRMSCSNNKTYIIVHNFTSQCIWSRVNIKMILVAQDYGSNEKGKPLGKILDHGVSGDKKLFILPIVLICIAFVVFVVFLSVGVAIRSSRKRRHRLRQTEEAVFDFRYNKVNHKECSVSKIFTSFENITNPFLACAKVCLKHLNIDVSTENDSEDFVVPKSLSNETRKISYYGTIHMNLSQKKQPIMADFCEETEPDQPMKISPVPKPKSNFHNRQLSISV